MQNNCIDCGTFANKVLNRSCRWSLDKLTAYLVSFCKFRTYLCKTINRQILCFIILAEQKSRQKSKSKKK